MLEVSATPLSLSRLIYSVRGRVYDVRAPIVWQQPITTRVRNEAWKSQQINFTRVFCFLGSISAALSRLVYPPRGGGARAPFPDSGW